MIPKHVLVVYYRVNYGAWNDVKKVLQKYRINYTAVNRKKMHPKHFRGKDVVITIGGDGTFLKTSHHVTDALMLGVCSNANKNVGYLLRSSRLTFEDSLRKILNNEFKVAERVRLETTINGKKTKYALNDVFIGSRRAYHTARYNLRIGGKEEFQMSSGIIISTATGSTGWIKSAGGIEMPLHSGKFQYYVRDPYSCKFSRPRLLKGILSSKENITVKSLIYEGVVAIDSSKADYSIDEDSVVNVRVAEKPLRVIEF
jgi:NAD kinase